jgi:hypothetical protein
MADSETCRSDRGLCMCVCVCVCVYIYIYIYINQNAFVCVTKELIPLSLFMWLQAMLAICSCLVERRQMRTRAFVPSRVHLHPVNSSVHELRNRTLTPGESMQFSFLSLSFRQSRDYPASVTGIQLKGQRFKYVQTNKPTHRCVISSFRL